MIIEQSDQQRALILKTLADPNRLRMIRILYQSGHEMTCGEVGEHLKVSKSTVSYHFKLLRMAGLTNTRQVAQQKYLSINLPTFNAYLPGFLDSL